MKNLTKITNNCSTLWETKNPAAAGLLLNPLGGGYLQPFKILLK